VSKMLILLPVLSLPFSVWRYIFFVPRNLCSWRGRGRHIKIYFERYKSIDLVSFFLFRCDLLTVSGCCRPFPCVFSRIENYVRYRKKKEIKLNGKKPSSLAWFQSVYWWSDYQHLVNSDQDWEIFYYLTFAGQLFGSSNDFG